MHKRSISGLLLVMLLATGCAVVPERILPGSSAPAAAEPEREEQTAETPVAEKRETAQRQLPVAPAVPTPPIKSGNEALFQRAKELLADGKANAAEVLFMEITESQPELAGPWTNLGHIYAAKGDDEEARRYLSEALRANPQNCEALTLMGVLARKHGLFNEAEDYYQRCIKAQPFFAAAHLNLGILYELYMGRLSEALAAYNEYQTLVPEPNVKVAGWVMDLERRVAAVAQR